LAESAINTVLFASVGFLDTSLVFKDVKRERPTNESKKLGHQTRIPAFKFKRNETQVHTKPIDGHAVEGPSKHSWLFRDHWSLNDISFIKQ
jgi:hypothetical protein